MNCRRTHKKLITFGFSVLMTLAFFAAAPQGLAADSSGTNPTNAVSSPPLTAAQFKKLSALLDQRGVVKKLGQPSVETLGLPGNVFRQLCVRNKKSGDYFLFIPLPNNELLVSLIDTKTAYNYRLDSNLKIIKSCAMNSGVASEIKNSDAGAKAVLAYWAHVADQISD